MYISFQTVKKDHYLFTRYLTMFVISIKKNRGIQKLVSRIIIPLNFLSNKRRLIYFSIECSNYVD